MDEPLFRKGYTRMFKGMKVMALSLTLMMSLSLTDQNVFAEEIELEERDIFTDDMNMIAQLVEAEAGDQDLEGKRLVVDVVLNRVESDQFPNTVEEVIYQKHQFSVIRNGAFERAEGHVQEECYEAVRLEYEERKNCEILFFGMKKKSYMKHGVFKHQDHWFGY